MTILLKIEGSIILDAIVAELNEAPSGNWVVQEHEWQAIGMNINDSKPIQLIEYEERKKRDALLIDLDTIVNNPLRWAALTQEQQTAYATYRQALLDVPQQSGFPTDIVWPTLPQ